MVMNFDMLYRRGHWCQMIFQFTMIPNFGRRLDRALRRNPRSASRIIVVLSIARYTVSVIDTLVVFFKIVINPDRQDPTKCGLLLLFPILRHMRLFLTSYDKD
jgi:hypothetical protein